MNSRDALLQLLKRVPFLTGLDTSALESIASRCRRIVVPASQHVFMEGDPCVDLYILEAGRVKFYRVSADGREQILNVFENPGDSFCLASAFSTGSHVVGAMAAIETQLHLLDMNTVNQLVRTHPSMGLSLMAAAGAHMSHLVDLAEDLALKSATERLAKYLHELAVIECTGKAGEMRISRQRLREEELASMLGTVRVHVSRILNKLAQAGAIDLERDFIRIRDLSVLARIAGVK
jgi:CRP-like cAMP-binding protein